MLLRKLVLTRQFTQSCSATIWRKPRDNYAISSKYGWFLIPKTHFAPRWTTKAVNEAIEKKIKAGLVEEGNFEGLQDVVDAWAETTDLDNKPAVQKRTRADLQRLRDQALYRSQIKENVDKTLPIKATAKLGPRTRAPTTRAVSFIHAWNYYLALHHKEHVHLGSKEARKQVAHQWNLLSDEEKESYREAYAELLEQGKDFYKGEIVSREEKLKRSRKKK